MDKSNKPKSSKQKNAKKKGSKLLYKGNISVIIDDKNASNEALLAYMNRVNSSVSVQQFFVVQSNQKALFETPQGQSYECLTVPSTAAAVEVSSGDIILQLDDISVEANTLSKWLIDHKNVADNQIWAASRMHPESSKGKDYVLGLGAMLLNLLARLFLGIVCRDVQLGYRLFPAAVAKLLYRNQTANNTSLEILYMARLYDIDVVEKAVHLRGKGPNIPLSRAVKESLFAWFFSWKTWFIHYFVQPFKDKKFAYFERKESPLFRFSFALLALIMFVGMPWLSTDFGITADEVVQKTYGDHLLDWYDTDGQDIEAMTYKDLYNYGGLFDYMAARTYTTFDNWGWQIDHYDVRHRLNSLFGAIMMLFIGLVGRLVTKSWAGAFLSLLFALLSPRIFGHSMNNPKDIPFAMAYIFTVYHGILFCRQLPKPTLRTSIALIIGIAAAINIRIGGLLLIAYVAAFSGITFLWKPSLRKELLNIKLMVKMFGIGAVIALAGLWCGSLYWPYAAQDWLNAPFKVLDKMSNYYVGIRVLFDSTNFWSDTVPWNYIPKWLTFTTPLFIISGLALAAVFAFLKSSKSNLLWLFLACFAALFPICYVIYQKSGLYDAMRHMLFAYTLFPVIAAFGWYSMLQYIPQKTVKITLAVPLLILLALPAVFMLKNHPYQYTYFNELIGGNNGAFMKYESDYWMTSMKQSCEWYNENIAQKDLQDTLIVATNCIYPVQYYLAGKNIRTKYVRYHEREKHAWDYGIFFSRFINRKFLLNNAWPPGELLHAEKVDDVPLGVVVKRISSPTAEAGVAFAKKEWANAAVLLEEIVNKNPKNESAYLLLAQTYSTIRDFPKMKESLDKLLEISDQYSNTWGMLGAYYLNIGNQEEAKKAFLKTVELNYKYTFGNFQLARIYTQENNLDAAIKCLEQFDAYGGKPAQGYDLGMQIAQKTGNNAQYYFFSAKKMSVNRNWGEAMKLLNSCLAIDPEYKPALKMQRDYDNAVEQQRFINDLKQKNQMTQ
jgi:tetratricopeptide (TPR) repeat protein